MSIAGLDDPLFTGSDVAAWPLGSFELLSRLGLLLAAQTASHVTCDACSEAHVEPVFCVTPKNGPTRWFITCPEAGRVQIDDDHRRQWRLSRNALVTILAHSFAEFRDPVEVRPGNLWRIGAIRIEDRESDVFVGALNSQLSVDGLRELAPQSSIVLRLDRPTVPAACEDSGPLVVPLESVVRLDGEQLSLDIERVRARLTARGGAVHEGGRSDGIYAPRTIVWRGQEHDCDMTRQESAFLSIALFNVETNIGDLMRRDKGAVWYERYTAKQSKRDKISQLISRLNRKLLEQADPPLRVQFNLRRGSDFVTRTAH